MNGIPWHPLLVHVPIALAVFLPIAALIHWLARSRSGAFRLPWAGMVVFHALVFGSGFLAMQAGETDGERVGKALSDAAPLEDHEQKGELFVQVSGAVLLLAVLGLAPGNPGLSGRIAASLASLAILLLGFQAGHSGGELIYKHGAAAAYTGDRAGNPAEAGPQPLKNGPAKNGPAATESGQAGGGPARPDPKDAAAGPGPRP